MGKQGAGRRTGGDEGAASVLYLDDTPERTAVETYAGDATEHIRVETVADLPTALDALGREAYDCLVVDPDLEGSEPAAVTAALREAAPGTPLVGYTAVDVTDLDGETVDDMTTLVQKGEAVHRRFLLEKLRAVVRESGDDTRYDELAGLFADEAVGVLVFADDGGIETAGTGLEELGVTTPVADAASLFAAIEARFGDGTELRRELEAAVETGTAVVGRVGRLPEQGEDRYVAWWCAPVGDRTVVFSREVTDEIRRRRRLERLETLVELAQDGMYVLDADGRIEYCNEAFAEMMGYDREELVGRYLYDLMLAGGLREGQRLVQEAIEDPDHSSRIIELPLERADGQRRWLAVQCTAIPGEDGSYGGLVNVARDVTERKEREQSLERQRERLAEQNERLETVARMVSEEFSEPIEDALAALDAAEDPSDPAVLDRVMTNLEQVESSIEDHLEVTREDRQDDPVVPVDLDGAADDDPGREQPDETDAVEEADHDTAAAGAAALRVLVLDGDDDARERLAARIGSEPDITADAVSSLPAAATLDGDHGAVVADPNTLDGDTADVVAAADDRPLLVYTARPGKGVYDEFERDIDGVLGKGGAANRAFVVEKLRSLTGIGRPDTVDLPWQDECVADLGAATDLLVTVVEDGSVTATNQPVGDVLGGYEGDSLHGFLRERLVNGDQYADWLGGPGTPGLLCELPTADGRRFYRCWRWNLGEETVEVYRDVTAEVDRADRLDRARALVEEARDAIHVLDASGELVYCNAALCDLLGYDREELYGMDMTRPIHPDDLHRGQQAIQELIDDPDRESAVVELDVVTADGERRTSEINYTLTPFDENGSYTGLMAVSRDVTEQRAEERELRRRREQLQRTNELLERFASIVSHDLRNPMTVAMGHVEVLRERDNPESVGKIRESLVRMREMLEELLSFARLGGEIDPEEEVDIADVAADAWATVDSGTATLEVEFASYAVTADRAKLLHVFENLFRNAVEHGSTSSRPEADDAVEHGSTNPDSHARQDAVEHGSTSSRPEADDAVEHSDDVTVTVGRLDGESADGFYVADDGPGIPEEERESVFEYGYSTSQGTGIGLAIAKDVIRAHGWELTATESEAGGARFEVAVRR